MAPKPRSIAENDQAYTTAILDVSLLNVMDLILFKLCGFKKSMSYAFSVPN